MAKGRIERGIAARIRARWTGDLLDFAEEVLIQKRHNHTPTALTQEDVAQRLGILDHTRISRLESGLWTPKDYPTAEAIVRAYELNEAERARFLSLVFGLTTADSSPLFITYPPFSIAFYRTILEVESLEGDTFLVKDGFGAKSEPLPIYKERLQPFLEGNPEESSLAQELLDVRRERIALFKEQVKNWMFLDIISNSAIQQFALSGLPPRDDSVSVVLVRRRSPLTPRQRVKQLQNQIELLEEFGLSKEMRG